MTKNDKSVWLGEEVARFLATCPSRRQLLDYRPSAKVKKRLAQLLAKVKHGQVTSEEQWELDQFEYVETVMRMVKAHLRPKKAART